MAVKKLKPRTSGMRGRRVLDSEALTTGKSFKKLKKHLKKHSGRGFKGHISVSCRGGGAKRSYRMVDFKRNESKGRCKVKSIEYDPYRTANICLVSYENGVFNYIIAPEGIRVGDVIESGEHVEIKSGNVLPLRAIPVGATIHNVELSPDKGAQLARSAGTSVVLMAKHDKYATIKLPSGETRMVLLACKATLGVVGNSEQRNIVIGKAGANRWRGKRPHVRGAVMNPCDHPHGGGEGKAPVGRSGPVTKTGKPALGYRTRKKKLQSSKYIIRRRTK